MSDSIRERLDTATTDQLIEMMRGGIGEVPVEDPRTC